MRPCGKLPSKKDPTVPKFEGPSKKVRSSTKGVPKTRQQRTSCTRGQPSLHVWMQGHARTVPSQDDATDNDYHKYCNEKSPHTPRNTSPSTKHATKKSTGTRCFNAWSNTEIGRISFYLKGTVSSMLSLSPPKFRTK